MLRTAGRQSLASIRPYAAARLCRALVVPPATYFPRSVQVRRYAQPPGGGAGFPGMMMQPQHQKGDALKEYVSRA
jgi:hypothetical protein